MVVYVPLSCVFVCVCVYNLQLQATYQIHMNDKNLGIYKIKITQN